MASGLGIVDASGLQLGSLFLVDPASMTARGVGTFEPVRYERTRSALLPMRRERITSDLAIDFAAGSELPSGWEPLARRVIARSGVIEALGYQTESILNLELYLEDRAPLHQAARDAAGRDGGIFYLVTCVGQADSVRIGLEGGVRNGTIARLTTPEGTLSLDGSCLAGSAPVRFVRCTPYHYVADDQVLELDTAADLDLSRVDFTHAYVGTR